MNYAIDLNKYYLHIVAIPTNKGANSYKLIISKIWEQKFLRLYNEVFFYLFLYSTRSIPFDDSGISYGQATIKQQ